VLQQPLVALETTDAQQVIRDEETRGRRNREDEEPARLVEARLDGEREGGAAIVPDTVAVGGNDRECIPAVRQVRVMD
jgi:hypothetical protein